MIIWEKTDFNQVDKSSFSYDLPMLTSTASVHVSFSMLDMEHKYHPPCSAVARSICRYHNRLPLFVFLAIPPHMQDHSSINKNFGKILTKGCMTQSQ